MRLDSRGGVSIAELVSYSPLLVAAALLCQRHGFERPSGWVFILILCIIRITGSACNMVTYRAQSTSLYQAVFILDSVGISPLLFATLGLLTRILTWVRAHSETSIRSKHFRFAQLIFTGGLILSIVGGINSRAAASPGTLSQVAIVLYFLGLAACVFFEISAWAGTVACGSVPASERSTVYAVVAALPLIFTRILFSALAVFLHDSTFGIVRRSTGVYVGMVVIQEALLVVMYTIVGWQLDRLDYN
ncbi:hypothetical protein INS49_013745 [Diaporthe citri]|uniref:uncharacterized protein n=1 Tax=Diaporthe citri TaxID=83186 RepID=UPI001C822D70|nr:uncharacterized protein INS49_013745 [Diaporthe citri]KAG6357864.1 hypothetical protein INS49_013745 [Diaporthe citri]